jgi:biopolymer transport protein ExbD
MGFQTQEQAEEVMSEINMTPLVDVMLVLLIIFMVTMPVMRQAVQVELPRANSQPLQSTSKAVRLSVLAEGGYDLDGKRLAGAELAAHLTQVLARDPHSQLLIEGDRMARYDLVAQALSTAHRVGFRQVGFVTEQTRENP